ncbi:MAG TPA: SDR family NAD(P)-dependent oxidoreductase [Acidimicrobiia bacterium]|nr:SDR family NAD(P)-dependent oxidoreductase [Acidimicrobiia bacterium]
MEIEGSVALITGGASGLGLGAASRLIIGGGSVVLLDIDERGGTSALEELGDRARFLVCDVRNPAMVADAVASAAAEWGKIDVLVNAAGVAPAQRVISRDGEMFDLDLFEFVIRVNLVGMFDVIRHVAAVMARNEGGPDGERGVIVNVASIAAFEGQVGQAAYSASKGGIVGMTLPLARDLAGIGIRVVAIAPGIMDTPLLGGAPPELKDALAGLHVFPRRLGTPSDFAHLVQAIVENPLLNGEVIRLDAGARMPPR